MFSSIGSNANLRLFSISFALLFFEVLLIRWVPCEIRMFGFFNNVILIAAVVGMGLGCAGSQQLDEKTDKRVFWFPVLMAVVAALLAAAPKIGLQHMSFQFVLDSFVWDSGVSTVAGLFYNVFSLTAIFVLLIACFSSLGRELGVEISQGTPNHAYTVNLLGSLAGLIVYSLLCFCLAPPLVWLVVGSLALLPFYRPKWMMAVMLVPIILSGIVFGNSIWSPYYRIDVRPRFRHQGTPQQYQDGLQLLVNHVTHQSPANLSDAFVKEHPEIKEDAEFKNFSIPYVAVPHPKNVLVLGSGTGNDVAAALRHGAEHVDAVEIDPAILALGHKIHPEKPYDDPRVTAYNNDGRTIMGHSDNKYDLIVFGYVDSHTAFSALSSVRLDNFLYTKESLEAAKAHLAPHGVVSLSFAGGPDWLRARLYRLITSVYSERPIVLNTKYFNNLCFIILSGPGIDDVRDSVLAQQQQYVMPEQEFSTPVEVTTDDWPFLYQQGRTLPVAYLVMLVLIIGVCSTLIVMRFRLTPTMLLDNGQFFFLGAAFLLLETRAMLAMSVLFGSTWIVNSVVIGIVLLMALIANILVQKYKSIDQKHGYAGLITCLVLMYLVPLGMLSQQPDVVRYAVASLIIGLPFLFSGFVFSRAFSQTDQPNRALGINILGALLGGCLEYGSTITGVNALILVAIALYAISMAVRYLKPPGLKAPADAGSVI
jgi:hypothetical protein